jgi:predicted transcriptional regulator
VKISESELLDELRASIGAGERPEGFHTVGEYAEQLGCGKDLVRRHIEEWTHAGRIESMLASLPKKNGARQRVMVYKLTPKKGRR